MVDDRGEDGLPTRFVVDATENSKEGVAAEVYSPPDWSMIRTFMHLCIRTYYVHDQIFSAKKKRNNPLRSGLGMDM